MDLSKYRKEFPITERMAYLDHAAVSPISLRVKKWMDQWSDEALHIARPAFQKWIGVAGETYKLAGQMVGADAADVAITTSTSVGISLFLSAIDWRPTDNVVTAANEFHAVMFPCLNLKRRGVRVKLVKPTVEGRVLVDDIVAAIDRWTRAVVISWVGYSTGFRIDVARLAAECRKRGVHLMVDAIQGLGAFSMRAAEWGLTAVAADAHKWLAGPEGVTLLYFELSVADTLYPHVAGWKTVKKQLDFTKYDFIPADGVKRFEPGTQNMAGIHGLRGALELFSEVGFENVTARVKELTDYLVAGLRRKGIAVRSPRGDGEWSGIVIFPAPGGDGPAVQAALEKKGIVCTGRLDFMRVSPHFYNTEGEIDRLLAEV